MTVITLSRVTDWHTLGQRWREFEVRCDCSFFQSWTWIGCMAEERYSDPVLLEARLDQQLVAMALFNRRRGPTGRQTLWLGETGVAALDAVFIEYNGILTERGAPAGLLAECMRAARSEAIEEHRPWRGRHLVLSGVEQDTVAAALASGGGNWVRRTLATPYVNLDRVRRDGGDFLAGLSANARYQLRRSDRAYAAEGDIAVQRAGSVAEAQDFLGQLAALHQTAWQRRGRPGSFADARFGRFHRALIERGFARGEIELLRVCRADRPVGFLYNLHFLKFVLSYQSGFDYATAGRHQKPGMTCHHQAIRLALATGAARYDFLAGEDRYKRSLANAESRLYWVESGSNRLIYRGISQLRAWLGNARSLLPPRDSQAWHDRGSGASAIDP